MKTEVARQFWIQSPGYGRIVAAQLPPRQEGEVLVHTLFTGISRGTESMVYRGEVPESQRELMRAPFQEGDFPAPVKYGYSSVGIVADGPNTLTDTLVFCLYPHQDRYCVPATEVVPLPSGVPAERAVLGANAETALNAVWDIEHYTSESMIVIGAGVVGLLTGWLYARTRGVQPLIYDTDPHRAKVAAALGLRFTEILPAEKVDLVIHASGQPEGLRQALSIAERDATILELSWYGDQQITLPLGEAFHSHRLTIKSSQVGSIPPHRRSEWTHRARLEAALDLLVDPSLDVLISGESSFDDLPKVMEQLSQRPGGTLCHRIRYPTPNTPPKGG
ncbi:MAG: zinc-binding alcohol dehydrogenase [Gemmatimonadetes bacterium]|nr:zinc-binding alcohol dehydrogenase [Gemmatimonadota bacterium]